MRKSIVKRSIIVFLILISISAVYTYIKIGVHKTDREDFCFKDLAIKLDADSNPEAITSEDFEKLQILVEFSLAARAEMLLVSKRLGENKELPLRSRDLIILREGTENYYSVRKDLLEIANMYECGLEVSELTLQSYGIDHNLKLKGLMISLSAALTLYDNYLLGVLMFEQDSRLRNLINDPDMGFGLVANMLREMTLNANSIETRYRIRKVISFYEESIKELNNLIQEDSDFAYLDQLIQSSPSYNYVKRMRIKEITSNKFIAFERIAVDLVAESSKDGIDLVSGVFGNTMGLFESRKGKLYGNIEVKNHIAKMLKPLDILLEKTPFRLTDKLIPGHFGHVAIWTGTKGELIDLGVWESPYVQKHAEILSASSNENSKNEHQIIEALRSGVQLSTLDDFLNIDDFVILRPIFKEGKTGRLAKEALIMAFRQLGKKYDFNFDVNTTDKIVCSELAYVSFPSIDWPTEKTLGRHNISPDNVAKLAWNNLPLELMLFYHDGKLVDPDNQLAKMKELMKTD